MDNDNGTQVDQSEEQAGHAADDREKYVTLEAIAELGWEAHRAWERIIGDYPTLQWHSLHPDRQEEIKQGVAFILNNPHAAVSAQHDHWRAIQASKPATKARPRETNMVPYEQLP